MPPRTLAALACVAALLSCAATAAGGTARDTKAQRLLQQFRACSVQTPPEGAVLANLTRFPGSPGIYVYASSDFVSQGIRANGQWEQNEVLEVLWGMEQVVPGAALFVDVGANIGSISLAVAAHGHTVVAFEGMPRNAAMLHSSLCANPGLMPRVTLVAAGLGASPATCWLFADPNNRGDGVSDCHSPTREAAALLLNATGTVYGFEGEMHVQRLDAFLDSNVRVLKVDVEGLESLVLQGATSLLARRTVWFLIIEFNVKHLSISMAPRPPTDLIDELVGYGYRLSTVSLKGPFADTTTPAGLYQLKAGCMAQGNLNIFAVHERAPLDARAREGAPAREGSAHDAATRAAAGGGAHQPSSQVLRARRSAQRAAAAARELGVPATTHVRGRRGNLLEQRREAESDAGP